MHFKDLFKRGTVIMFLMSTDFKSLVTALLKKQPVLYYQPHKAAQCHLKRISSTVIGVYMQ